MEIDIRNLISYIAFGIGIIILLIFIIIGIIKDLGAGIILLGVLLVIIGFYFRIPDTRENKKKDRRPEKPEKYIKQYRRIR